MWKSTRLICAAPADALVFRPRSESMSHPTPIALATLAGVILCWIFFAGIFLLRKRPPKAPDAKRDRTAGVGIFLQMCGYFLVFFQPPHQPFLPPIAALSGVS